MDAFSKCHPAVNFLFFAGAIGMSVVIQHPAYLLVGILAGMIYYFLLNGKKGFKLMAGLLPMFVLITVVNPIFNTLGGTALFYLFERPYTLEALMYGGVLGGMFLIMMLWFGCYNKVMTSDKFTSLFGGLIPSVSLMLVMILRLIPNFVRKAQQLMGARKSVGKGAGEAATTKEKFSDGMTVLGALTGWALEGSVVTADSMRARGYGVSKRTSFMIYRMGAKDWILLIIMLLLLGLTITAMCLGQTGASFIPTMELADANWGIGVYAAYLLIPTLLYGKEAVQWRISRSKI